MDDKTIPSDDELRLALARALEQMRLHGLQMTEHAEKLTEFVAALHARVSGTESVAAVVDENETQAELDRQMAAGKELISFIFEKGHQYVTIIVAGAYAAYFATLSAVTQRFSDNELRISAALMTASVTVFALWEVLNIALIGVWSLRGKLDSIKQVPRWQQIGWPLALALALLTALPAIGLSICSYVTGLLSN